MVDRFALLTDLKKLLKLLQDDLRTRCDEDPELDVPARAEWQATREAGRTAEDYTVWREEWLTQVGAAWLLASVFVRFMEDNDLIGFPRLSGPDHRRRRAQDNRTQYFNEWPTHSDRDYLLNVFETIAAFPAVDRLFDRRHNPLWKLGPSGDLATRIVDFWHRIDPTTGTLVHDFTDATLDTRFLGDLYQDLSEEARKKYALFQTPGFVEEFILDRTLLPAIEVFGYRDVRIIDPACGSGHFLLGAFNRLFAIAQRREPNTNPRELARRSLAAVHGVDINPFAVAIARFRLLVAAVHSCQLTELATAPAFPLEVYTGDSLLLGKRMSEAGAINVPLDPDAVVSRALAVEDAKALDRVLGQPYHVVVGNPPYITPKDAALSQAYRERYPSCHRQYSLAVPFMERFFDLACSGEFAGFVGMITTTSFMRREFGKKLIEQFFPRWDLTHVLNTSGVPISGHGTGSLIIFGRGRSPQDSSVRVVMPIRDEPGHIDDPSQGVVWRSIMRHVDVPGSQDEYITCVDMPRKDLARHPWSLGGGGAAELKIRIEMAASARLASLVKDIGAGAITREDELFLVGPAARRHGIPSDHLRAYTAGEDIRDWQILPSTEAIWPYDATTLLPTAHAAILKFLWPWRRQLGVRVAFGKTQLERGLHWWEYSMFFRRRYGPATKISLADISTHNHFVVSAESRVFKETAPVIVLREPTSHDEYVRIAGLLNSSVGCFWLKQVFYPKGGDGVGRGIQDEPWETRYASDSVKIKSFPLASGDASAVCLRLADLGARLSLLAAQLAAPGAATPSRSWLTKIENESRDVRSQAIALQEEVDWDAYRLYGLVEEDLRASDGALPDVSLGERAFEIAMARSASAGEMKTAWFERHGSSPSLQVPARWPEPYRQVIERRIAAIDSDPVIALIERPEYKRRWSVEAWETQKETALRNWLTDRLESPDYWRDLRLTTCAELAERAKRDAEFMQVAEAYRDNADFDVARVVNDLITNHAIPFLAVLRHKESGVRKRDAWERTWELQRKADAVEARTSLPENDPNHLTREVANEIRNREVGEIPVPPKYALKDFRSNCFWRLRGKLDVPKESFISYPGASRDLDSSLVVAWAGWDHLQQARSLSAYYLLVKEQDGWSVARLTPLLAGLLELIPWLKQWHNDVDPETGERLGDYFDTFLETQARALRLTRAAIRAWKP